MDKCAIFRVFLGKILREYKFSWIFKFCFLVLIPIALICTYLKISHQHEVHKGSEIDIFEKVRLEIIAVVQMYLNLCFCFYQRDLSFPGGEDDKLFFYPDNQITINIIEELRIPLDIIYQSKYSH